MKFFICIGIISLIISSCNRKTVAPEVPKGRTATLLYGNFTDDYDLTYEIDRNKFLILPDMEYEILDWYPKEKFFIAKDLGPRSDYNGLYARVDWVELNDSDQYSWAYCITVFDAVKPEDAFHTHAADREQLKTGCHGYPFSRMQRIK